MKQASAAGLAHPAMANREPHKIGVVAQQHGVAKGLTVGRADLVSDVEPVEDRVGHVATGRKDGRTLRVGDLRIGREPARSVRRGGLLGHDGLKCRGQNPNFW